MKRLFCVLLIAILLSGCAEKAPVSESIAPEVPEQTTLATEEPIQLETVPTDYVGEEPTQEELSAFFVNYVLESYADFPNVREDPNLLDKIYYIGTQDGYAGVAIISAGVDILIWDVRVYRFDCCDGQILVTDVAHGETPISEGLSVNYVQSDGRYFYYGVVSDYHWDSREEVRIPIEWKTLRFTDADGNSVDMDMVGKLAYLCILEAPLADFQVIDQGGNVCVTYDAYIEQGRLIREQEIYPIEE